MDVDLKKGKMARHFNPPPMTEIINQKLIAKKGEFTMTAKELQKRGAKAELLRVLQTEDGSFYAESAEGKILYRVIADDQETSCTCADFTRNSKKDSNFQCKHILSVLNCVPTGDIESVQYLDRKKPKLDERWIIEIEGNQFVKYAGLLDYAHALGISQIEVEPLQLPNKENGQFAICKATVISNTGKSFVDLGDASIANTTARVSKHILRMASTRAIARALRLYTGIGLTALEELADLKDVIGSGPKTSSKPNAKMQTSKKPKAAKSTQSKSKTSQSDSTANATSKDDQNKTDGADNGDGNKPKGGNGNGRSKPKAAGKQPAMSEAQKRAIYNLSRRRGVSVENLEEMSLEAYGVAVENLSSKDASSFIRHLQSSS
jgi:predicted nucleic acid-binding Zn finger protein